VECTINTVGSSRLAGLLHVLPPPPPVTNLITAVQVEDCICSSQIDDKLHREQTRNRINKLIPDIKKAFEILDRASQGHVKTNRLREIDFASSKKLQDVVPLLRPQFIDELCEVVDVNGDGYITEDELVNGILHLSFQDPSIELAQIKNLMMQAKRTMRHMRQAVDQTNEVLSGICKTLPASTPQS